MMAPRDHEDDDLTLHDLIEGPTRDLTAARAAALARTNAAARPTSDDHEVDGTSRPFCPGQLHDRARQPHDRAGEWCAASMGEVA
ncbi:hypothetical protein [Micromonospora chalcea]|uniref:Uncharacterized protein n=1 Tax=Micromonospora chalcea TaxID=1874 RepID=A0ABX9XVA1_MICCH|nr:hypothetical protein [Micromonospora chalcea]RQW86084.1 hypothetical protein DLJ60_28915 [Micromonospora chalcea]